MEMERGPGQRAGLSHAAVLTAARDLLADGGVDALTMRSLAGRLQVAPNTLYSHVESKTALLDDLLDDLLASVEAPGADADDPVAALGALMTSTYDVLTAHPDIVPLSLARRGSRGPNAVRLGEIMDALLARAGITGAEAAQARRVLIIHAIGSAAFATGGAGAPRTERALPADEDRRSFIQSLNWLLVGITQSAKPRRSPRSK